MFSNFVATIRADLDAIKDDLDEFVTTVKTDVTAAVGIAGQDGDQGHNQPGKRYSAWEEGLWENPDLLCQDPEDNPEWDEFAESYVPNDEEIEGLLSGGVSDVIPDLYKELVPAQTTHNEFFKRLIFHRKRLDISARLRMKAAAEEEEDEAGWDDEDSLDDGMFAPNVPVPTEKQTHQVAEPRVAELEESEEEAAATPKKKGKKKASTADNSSPAPVGNPEDAEENKRLQAELKSCKEEMATLRLKVEELQNALERSEGSRAELERKLANAETDLPHKKVPSASSPAKAAAPPVSTTPDVSEFSAASSLPPASEKSWEALQGAGASSNEEAPALLSEEEDDWE